MKKIDFFQSNGLYMARSCASANSLYFENANDHRLFFDLLDRYLGGIIEIVHYAIIPTAWLIVFKTKSEDKIKEFYYSQREKSQKAKIECMHTDVGRMISEHFRIFNAQYVKKSNARNWRHGSKVHSRFEKFVFESQLSMQEEIDKMEALLEFNQQWLSRYYAHLGYYDPNNEMQGEHVLKSAKLCYSGKIGIKSMLKCFKKLIYKVDVVRKLILATWKTHFGKNPPNPDFLLC